MSETQTATPHATPNFSESGLRVLIVDDESLARSRLRSLLGDCTAPAAAYIADVGKATDAMAVLVCERFDVVLLDIHMPGMDGLALAKLVKALPNPPALVFVTAHTEHAVEAFELEAQDYLTKPVRLERLQSSLLKAERHLMTVLPKGGDGASNFLVIHERDRTERIDLAEVLCIKAELKYLTVCTVRKAYLYDGALNDLEARHGEQFLRVHRNALVARHAMRALEKLSHHHPDDDADTWVLRLHGVDDTVAVSRRQLPAVRAVLVGASR